MVNPKLKSDFGLRFPFSLEFILNNMRFSRFLAIFDHFWPLLAKIGPLTLKQFKQNFTGAYTAVVSHISEKSKIILFMKLVKKAEKTLKMVFCTLFDQVRFSTKYAF
jgi:hypothetical protein